MPDTKSTSKFISLVLRHDPARFGVALDDHGWTDVAALLAALAANGHPITRDDLAHIVATSDKKRFALSDDGARIRANQGHSVDVDLALEPVAPPDVLFHGTIGTVVDAIRTHGLVKGARHHVHLSADRTVAMQVGGRRGKPVILVVRAPAMAAAGHLFYRSQNGVWLADHVPPEFIEFPA
jgi:putative RNA 2'-phosphotransferase|nr:RNA 2'-phosphotransferase [Kofleriaceae bacterium]